MMFHFWYLICLLFSVINIKILIDESYDTIYRIIDQNNPIEYLYCISLDKIIINKTEINSNEIKNEFYYGLKWIQMNKKSRKGSLIISSETVEKIINQTKSIDYLIYQNKICFIYCNFTDFESFDHLLLKFKIDQNYFVFNRTTFSFLRLNYYLSRFNRLSIQHKEYPYSKCSKDYSNFKCLNDKIKKKQRLSKYYYRSNENVSIEFNYQINQTIIDNELETIKQCNQIDCDINLFYPSIMNSESITLKSFQCISKSDYYFQLVGLIVLFLNISIYRLINKITNSIGLRTVIFNRFKIFKYLKKLKRKYLKINNYLSNYILIILILLICLAILFSRSIYNFIRERDYPFNKTISVDSIKPELSIVICIDIKKLKGSDYNRSLSELEKETNNFLDIALKDIYLQFLNKKIPTKWRLESKLIAFRYFYYELERCFLLRIFLNQTKYRTIFHVTKLIIEFNKYEEGIIYILTDNEIFNSNSYRHHSSYNFRKRIVERSKLNQIKRCKDYNQVHNCSNKWNCIDLCRSRSIYNQIKNLTQNDLLIIKNHFTDKEWSNLFIKPDSMIYFGIDKNIRKECKDKYSEVDPCVDIKLERHYITNYKDNNKKEIDLNYDVIYRREDEPSIFKLLLDLLNIQSNLFGLNFNSLLFMILELFRFINLKLIKTIKLFIYLLCSIGFIFHLWSIYDEIINIEIIFSEYYELINTIQPPDLIFCFNVNQTKLNPNYKLTYEYLDKITKKLREDQIFNRIEYLNKSNQWTKLDNGTNFQDNNLKIRAFYYLDRKCFKIILNSVYNKNQFEFNDKLNGDDGLVFKIFLNRIYSKNKLIYFFTKTKNKIQFSRIEQLNLDYRTLKIKHELIVRDEFELIKNPLSFLSDENDQNDLDYFFNKLINYFDTKLNLVTFKLPINKTELNSNKELDDNLFIQLYNQKQDQINANHLREHSHNYLEVNFNWFKYYNLIADFEFSLSFYRKVIVVSNKLSLIKLIINLLNVLSFWFNLGILDLDNYFSIFQLLPSQLYKLLIIIKNQLKSFI